MLLVDWDPIGVFGYSGAMDEYDSYASEVCSLLRSGASREQLILHLDRIEKKTMGIRAARAGQAEVADKLLLLYKVVCFEDEQQKLNE